MYVYVKYGIYRVYVRNQLAIAIATAGAPFCFVLCPRG